MGRDVGAKVLQHRFASQGELDGHSTGNLLIVTVWDLLGDHVKGLDLVGQLLGARGRVLPMALDPLVITATVQGADPAKPDEITHVEGQVEVATTGGRLLEVGIQPQHPTPCPQALAAIAEADWVVLGPGFWYTSVIPHVLVPELREALSTTPAPRIGEPQPASTGGRNRRAKPSRSLPGVARACARAQSRQSFG